MAWHDHATNQELLGWSMRAAGNAAHARRQSTLPCHERRPQRSSEWWEWRAEWEEMRAVYMDLHRRARSPIE